MEKEQKEEILNNLQEKHSRKRIIIIIIALALLAILIFIGFAFYLYFKSPEKALSLGANIEEVRLSPEKDVVYIKLAGESNKNITKIKFVFKDNEGREHYYETSEGAKEINIPFKRGFFDWLFGKPKYEGVYDYEIKANEINLNNFQNIEEVSVSFEYKTETGEETETPILDTTKTTTTKISTGRGTSSGGTGNGGGTTTPGCIAQDNSITCANNTCGIVKNNCNNDVNCSEINSNYCLIQAVCGNEVVETGEVCDGTNLAGKNCSDFEFNNGTLSCSSDCKSFDTGNCQSICIPECTDKKTCVNGKCVNVYYVSVTGGTSPHNGSVGYEYTLAEAQAYANSHLNDKITFLLESGNYEAFSLTNVPNRTDWVTYKAATGYMPVFTTITIINSVARDAYLKFDGVNITSKLGSGKIVYVQKANYVEFLNCKMVFYDRYPNGDIVPEFAGNYLKIDNCEIYAPDPLGDYALPPISKARGMNIQGYNINITNNKIHDISSTGIYVDGPSSMLIENNEVYNHYFHWPGFRYSINTTAVSGDGSNTTTFAVTDRYYDNYYAKMYCKINSQYESYVTSYNYSTGTITLSTAKQVSIGDTVECRDEYIHGNSITLMSGNIIVRNNTMHSSRDGIAVYTVLVTNITIENNIMYDTTGIDLAGNTGALGVGPNVKINNNTIVMQYDKSPWEGLSGEWSGDRYGEAIQAPFDSSYDGSLELKNNVIVGRFGFSSNNFISENNIVFCTGDNLSNSIVFSPDCQRRVINSYKQLEEGWNPEEDFFVEENFNFSSNHYQERDLRPKASGALCNPAINSYAAQYGKVGALPCVPDCVNENTRVCGTDVGICVPGVETCVSDVWSGVCEGAVLPQEEVCGNSIDEDCDGEAPGCMEFKRISYWKFDDDLSDNMTIDENGNHNGTCSGARCPLYKPTGGIDGKGAYEFDGINDYINTSPITVTNYMTVSAWIKPSNVGVTKAIVQMYSDNPSNFLNIGLMGNLILASGAGSNAYSRKSISTVSANQWTHVVVLKKVDGGAGNISDIYINGVNGTQSSNSYWSRGSVNTVYIGAAIEQNGRYPFNGSIDEVMIYNRALSESEIAQIYCRQGGDTLDPAFCAGVSTLSPFAKLWNFLKSLLTAKTGKAILTGNVVNENNKTGTESPKIIYIILSLLVAIILIIAGVIAKIKKNKKKSKKRIERRIRRR